MRMFLIENDYICMYVGLYTKIRRIILEGWHSESIKIEYLGCNFDLQI